MYKGKDEQSNVAQGEAGRRAVRLIPLREVMWLTGRGRSRIYQSIKAGRFPAPIKDGISSSRWLLCEIEQWIEARVAERDKARAA